MFQHWRFPRSTAMYSARIFLLLMLTALSLGTYLSATSTAEAKGNTTSSTTNGLAQTPYMGWSSWSLESTKYSGYGTNWLTATNIEAQADALHAKLQSHGYNYVNIDAGWWMDYNWQPTYDAYGRPAPFPDRFPDGMASVVNYIHQLGLKVGIYYGAGLDLGVYNNNYPIYGTSCHAQDIAVQPLKKTNGWLGSYAIDYSNPCAQAYINSIADEFASWGVDFMKLDGVTPGSFINNPATSDNRTDVQAWSQALIQTQRPIQFIISWALDHNYVDYWKTYSNGWRIDTDVECYCDTLVTWNSSVKQRFTDVVPWINDAGPGGWNNLDSLDVGSGSLDGLNNDERQTTMTLWAIEAAPLYTGDDLTKLDDYGLSLLTNDEVLAIDQAGHPARPVAQSSNQQVWYAQNSDGSYTVALFNLDNTSATVTANWRDLGFTGTATVRDVWQHSDLGQATDSYSATLPAHGSQLLTVKMVPHHSHTVSPFQGDKAKSYEAESPINNTLGGNAQIVVCSTCSGYEKVGNLGGGGSVQFNTITKKQAGIYTMTMYYTDGDSQRPMYISVNGGSGVLLDCHGISDNNWNQVQAMQVSIQLKAGTNTIKFYNDENYAPDLDRITI